MTSEANGTNVAKLPRKGTARAGTTKLRLRSTGKALELRIRVELATIPGVRVWKHRAAKTSGEQGRAGLGVGISDLVGLVTMANGCARFLGLESKDGSGRASANQRRWINTVRRFGGYACVVRSVEDAVYAVEQARLGVLQGPL